MQQSERLIMKGGVTSGGPLDLQATLQSFMGTFQDFDVPAEPEEEREWFSD